MNRREEEMLEATLAKLRQKKVRITEQRIAILAYLIETDTHPTAEEIYDKLSQGFESASLATVYNNLNFLVEMNLVKTLRSADDAWHYDFNSHQHYHVMCDICGKIVDFDYPVLDAIEACAEKDTHFKILGHNLEMHGICLECQRKESNLD